MSDAVKTAETALSCLAEGFESGNFQSYFDMLTDDFTFWMPTGEFRGKNVGKELAARNYKFIAEAPNTKIVFSAPYSVTSNENTVVFEFEDGGTILGKPFKNRIAFSMDVRGDKICGFREYVGDIDPELFAQAAGKV